MSALRKVLVVDDDPMIGRSIKRILNKEYLVTTAADAKEALAKMANEEFDLVYTDIKMPGMSGIEFAETVKAKQPWTPIVIITGYGSTENEQRAKAVGVEGFLNKPLSPDMIEESVKSARVPPVLRVVTAETVEAAAPEAAPTEHSRLVSTLLFLSAPFIGLLYALFLPIVGLGMLAYVGIKAFAKTKVATHMARVGLFFAAPFIGLVYAVMLPFVGIGMLAYAAYEAASPTQKALIE